MKKKVPYLFILFVYYSFGQSDGTSFNYEDISARKKQLFFKVGTEYRITPISGSGNRIPTLEGLNTNTDILNTGAALSFGLEYFVTKNFSLGFDNTLRFDTVTINFGDIALDRGSSSNRKTFLFGWHFHANYYIKVFKKSELFFRIGLSRLNGGADVATQDLFRDDNGEIIGGVLGTFDLASFAGNFAIGYKNKRIEALLGINPVLNKFQTG